MKFFKKIVCLLLALALVAPQAPSLAFAAQKGPDITSQAGIIYCGGTGEILWENNSEKRMEPASITKLLTCLVALEELDLDEKVTITADIEAIEPTELGVYAGEEIAVRELIYGALLPSGNDAAVALAVAVSGSEKEFSKLMNEKAKKIGCTGSNFVTASGLEDENHYSTAKDLALITEAALSNEFIRKVCGTAEYTVPATNMSGTRKLENTNVFLYGKTFDVQGKEITVEKYKGVFGGKTGTLSPEYATMSTALKYDGMEVYCVILGSSVFERYNDIKLVMDYAKASISKYVVFKKGAEFDKVRLKGGAVNKVMAVASSEGFVNLPEGASASLVTTKCVYSDELKAPIAKGQKIGVAEIYIADDLISKVDLVAKEDVVEGWFLSFLGISNFQTILIGVVLALILAFGMTILYLRVQNKKKQQAIRKKKLMEEAKKQLEREEDLRRRNWHF